MRRSILRLTAALLLLWSASALHAQDAASKSRWIEAVASHNGSPNFAVISAKLRLGRDTAFAYRQLDTLLTRGYGDMFWALWSAAAYCSTQDVLRPDYKAKIRSAWKQHTPYRGDTENHFVMYYTAWLLMAQEFPDDAGDTWFNGKSSKENYADAKDFLVHWVDETARYGQTEWDSPRYGYYYITSLVLLAEYTRDATLKARFTKALDLVLADYAIEYLNGNYCGAHSRVSESQALDARRNEMSAYGAYFFGDSVANIGEDVAFAAMSHFTCPSIIRDIARDRSTPYELYEYKRGRTAIRTRAVPNAAVHKYTYMTDHYAMGSIDRGLVQPIQQQSWSLVLNGDSTPSVVTGHHPFVDSSEMTTYFPEYAQFMMERIGAVKQGYTSEDKWAGGSPYERIYQEKNVLAALYDIPDGVRFDHVDLFIPAGLAGSRFTSAVDSEATFSPSWIILHDNGTRVGIYLLSPYHLFKLSNGLRVRMRDPNAGYVAIADDISRPVTEFVKHLTSLRIERKGERVISKGDNGKTVDLPNAKSRQNDGWLYRSPYINSKLGSDVVTLAHGKDKLVLDFRR
jgi:hypothetical protein